MAQNIGIVKLTDYEFHHQHNLVNMKIYLDDVRTPLDNTWFVVRSYDEFVNLIGGLNYGEINVISFDHDLADFHYEFKTEDYEKMSEEEMVIKFGSMEKTGLDCAKFLVEYCVSESVSLPEYLVHSANPTGKENIEKFLENAKKHLAI